MCSFSNTRAAAANTVPEGKHCQSEGDHYPEAAPLLTPGAPRYFFEQADMSVRYIVRDNDTLDAIARDAFRHAFGHDPNLSELQAAMSNIMIANNMRLLRVVPGQKLLWDKTFSQEYPAML